MTNAVPRNWPRSVLAILTGFLAVIVLSIGTDEILRSLKIFPPVSEAMHDTRLFVLATAYRILYGALGSYIAAIFSPNRPMQHALALGGIGLVLNLFGLVAAVVSGKDFGPLWYPVVLVITAIPCAWLGGILQRRLAARH